MAIRFTLNGIAVEAEGFDPHLTLLQFLRDKGLTGTKEGCAEGECGACAVVLVRERGERAAYEPVNACLLLLASVAGREVWSVEGVGTPEALHPVQKSMAELGGSQCGYCTPGFVMSLFAEYYRPDRDGYDPEAISGNLCRCTGYRPIRDAAKGMGRAQDDAFKARLERAAPVLESVSHRASERGFFRPASLDEAIALLGENPNATLIAGGTDLVVEMNQRHKRYDTLISLENVRELRTFEDNDREIRLGAALTLSEIEHKLEGRVPMLAQLFPLFSSRLIRNRATFGGNLMTASPIGDGPPALLALDAEVELASSAGRRCVPLADFFTAYRKTAAKRGEILSAIRVPKPLPEVQRFYKVSKRVLDDISTVAAAFSLRKNAAGVITEARLAYGGVAATPARALDAERALVGETWSLDAVKKAQLILSKTFQPLSDHRGSADYRMSMVVRLLEKYFFDSEGKTP